MKTFKHSGTLGDLIYSLAVVKKMAEIDTHFLIALNNIENCVAQYDYRPDEVDPAHRGRFTVQDFELLKPLLERQPYISKVATWTKSDAEPDVDLDRFRSVLFRGFEGNYVEAYHRTFQFPYSLEDELMPWLEVDPIETKPIVVSRTFRYRTPDPHGTDYHRTLAVDADLENNGIFVGTEAEHEDYVQVTGVNIPYHPVKNFLKLANIVAGAELIVANQNFVYSLAMGLGKDAILETIKIKPLLNNECYFRRNNIQYF